MSGLHPQKTSAFCVSYMSAEIEAYFFGYDVMRMKGRTGRCWRELVVEETARSSPVDVTAAEEACRGLSPREREIATRAEDELRALVKRSAAGHHG